MECPTVMTENGLVIGKVASKKEAKTEPVKEEKPVTKTVINTSKKPIKK